MTERTFRIDAAMELLKAKPGGPEMPIRVLASTDHEDLSGEEVDQDGIDWSYFMTSGGWFNDEHDKTTGGGIGVPTSVKKITLPDGHKGTVVEGYLVPESEAARKVWALAQGLQRLGNPRRIQASVQGRTLGREGPRTIPWRNPQTGQIEMLGKRITKSWVTDVSLSRHGQNPNTALEALAKSLMAGGQTPAGGGGAGAPLLPQSLDGRVIYSVTPAGRRPMAKKKVKKGVWDALDPEAKELLKAQEYESDDDDEKHAEPDADQMGGPSDNDEDNEDMEKSLSPAFERIRGWYKAGLGFHMVPYEANGDATARADLVKSLIDAEPEETRGELLKSIGATSELLEMVPGNFDTGTQDLVKSLTGQVETLKAENGAFAAKFDAFAADAAGRFDALAEALQKSLKVVVAPRAIVPGVPLIPPTVEDSENLAVTQYGPLCKSLRAQYGAARDEELRKSITEVMTALESSLPHNRPVVTAVMLRDRGIKVPA